jgi:RIO kinase 1
MKTPKRIQPLIDDGLVDEVVSRLMSGKEADVFIVLCGDEYRCAKVYKEVHQRSFKKAATYQEGRKSRNSRRARAMEKKSKFGQKEQEAAWQTAEVDALYKVASAGVRVPKPYGCFDGVLLMEIITDGEGGVAPRLNDVTLTEEQAIEDHYQVMVDVMKMLSVGIIHGDLSEFNILLDEYGPVIIDLPQAVDASANNNAKKMLQRDVRNVTNYYSQYAPQLLETNYADEMWSLYEKGELTAETELTGTFKKDEKGADVDSVIHEIQEAIKEEEARLARIAQADSGD